MYLDNEGEDDEEISEEELSDEDLGDLTDDELDEDDLSDVSFDAADESEEPKRNGNKRKRPSSDSIFASAEEFASLLEDEGSSKIRPGGSNAVANKDNARKYIFSHQNACDEQKSVRFKTNCMGGKA